MNIKLKIAAGFMAAIIAGTSLSGMVFANIEPLTDSATNKVEVATTPKIDTKKISDSLADKLSQIQKDEIEKIRNKIEKAGSQKVLKILEKNLNVRKNACYSILKKSLSVAISGLIYTFIDKNYHNLAVAAQNIFLNIQADPFILNVCSSDAACKNQVLSALAVMILISGSAVKYGWSSIKLLATLPADLYHLISGK